MPAQSDAQRRLMAIAEHHPSEVSAKNRGVLKMSHRQLHEFASTSEKHLPEHKESHMDGLGHAGKHAPHHTIKHTHTEHHDDGTHTITHYHHHVPVPPKEEGDHSHAAANLDGVHDNLEEHLGAPNEGEEEEAAEMGGE